MSDIEGRIPSLLEIKPDYVMLMVTYEWTSRWDASQSGSWNVMKIVPYSTIENSVLEICFNEEESREFDLSYSPEATPFEKAVKKCLDEVLGDYDDEHEDQWIHHTDQDFKSGLFPEGRIAYLCLRVIT